LFHILPQHFSVAAGLKQGEKKTLEIFKPKNITAHYFAPYLVINPTRANDKIFLGYQLAPASIVKPIKPDSISYITIVQIAGSISFCRGNARRLKINKIVGCAARKNYSRIFGHFISPFGLCPVSLRWNLSKQ